MQTYYFDITGDDSYLDHAGYEYQSEAQACQAALETVSEMAHDCSRKGRHQQNISIRISDQDENLIYSVNLSIAAGWRRKAAEAAA